MIKCAILYILQIYIWGQARLKSGRPVKQIFVRLLARDECWTGK